MPVYFMQSDGGLTSVSDFSGHKAVLSGPAGACCRGFQLAARDGCRGACASRTQDEKAVVASSPQGVDNHTWQLSKL